ncbi:MAG: hypothetical protein JSW58_10205 [Candidatus Latescibacterota bacterium]|nr:MAG: hypothetical protein JSW58_10205 [Candidatus Latescibacterota bacterium]
MSARKTTLMTVVLLGVCALVAGCGSDSVITSPTVDEAPILPPQNVTAGPSATSKLVLSWDPNTQNKLAGYNVYRVTLDTDEIELLTPYFITATSFEDPSARRGVAYEYRVTSVSKNGKESAYVAILVELEGPDEEPLGKKQL